jgi:hypothetical protein
MIWSCCPPLKQDNKGSGPRLRGGRGGQNDATGELGWRATWGLRLSRPVRTGSAAVVRSRLDGCLGQG